MTRYIAYLAAILAAASLTVLAFRAWTDPSNIYAGPPEPDCYVGTVYDPKYGCVED